MKTQRTQIVYHSFIVIKVCYQIIGLNTGLVLLEFALQMRGSILWNILRLILKNTLWYYCADFQCKWLEPSNVNDKNI